MSPSTFSKSLAAVIVLAVVLAVGMPAASAQATYTWIEPATGTQPWTDGTNWASGQFVSDAANELMFFPNITTQYTSEGTQTITSVPAALSMNTLTLNGRGPNKINGFTILFDPASTWTIGDGTASTINLDSVKHSFDARSYFYKLPSLVLNQATTTITGNGNGAGFHFTGSISEAAAGYGILKSGSSRIDFQASNSYTGTTEVTGGILRLSHANALPGGIGATGGTSALTLNGGVIELAVGDFTRNLGTGGDQFQITGGASGFSAVGADRVVTVNGDKNLELVWGSAYFQPTTLELNSLRAYGGTNPRPSETDTTDHDLTFANKIDLNGATRNILVDSKTVHLPGVIRNSSGTAGINKSGNGTLLLTAANTYNGDTTLSGGTVSIETSDNAGGGGGIIFNGGTLGIRGTTLTELSGLGHAVTFNSNKAVGFDITDAANTFTANQVLNQGSGGLIKAGAGTLVLNQANTFTGATTITGGTLILDYGSGQDNAKIGNGTLTLNGGNLVLRGGSHAQAVTSIAIGVDAGNSISRDGGSTATIANAGSIATATGIYNSNLTISEAGMVSTTTANTNGIQVNGRVTVGSDFATNVSNLLQAYSAYTDYTAADANAVYTTVGRLTGGGTKTGTLSNYALKIENDANNNVLELGSNNLLVENRSTMLYAGGFDNNYTINGGGLVGTKNGNQPLNVNVFSGTLTVNARLTTGDTRAGTTLTKAGAGTLVAGGANTYGGSTYIQQGVLRLTNPSGLGTTAGSTSVQGGAALELSNNITVGAEALEINGTGISHGGALRNYSGSNTYGGPITIGASGARINADATTSLELTGGIATNFPQDVTFGGAGDTTVSTTAISGAGGLIKDGTGLLVLSAANTYTGATAVNGGTLLINGSTTAAGTVTVNPGAALGGTGVIGGAVVINSGGTISPGASIGTLTAGDTTWHDGGALQLEIAAATGDPGIDWDLLKINGSLDLSAVGPGGATIDVDTLLPDPGTNPGPMANFSPATAYAWEFVRTAGGIGGFDAAKFIIDADNVAPEYDGTFEVTLQGNSLFLGYTPKQVLPDPLVSTVVASPAAVPADGASPSTITVTLMTTDGTPVPDRTVKVESISGPGAAVIAPAAQLLTDEFGVATFTVTSSTAGTEVFRATDITDGGSIVITQTASVEFTPAIVSQTSLIPGYTPPLPPAPNAPQTSLATTPIRLLPPRRRNRPRRRMPRRRTGGRRGRASSASPSTI
jgi:autotransporter-associated beta strand protein